MQKRLNSVIIILFILCFLTGCWSRKEVTDLGIVLALGIDKNEDEEYIVSAQIINPSETATSNIGGGGGYDTPATTYTMSGKILFEGLRKLTRQAPRKLYLAHLRMIVIGEKVAKENIYNALDFLSRDHEMRTDYYIVVAKEHTAEETLKILTSIEKIPANKLFYSLESSSEAWAATGKVRLNDLIDDIVSDGTQPTLTGVTIRGNPKKGITTDNVGTISPKADLIYEGIAAFKKNKMVGWLNEEESKGLNYIKDQVTNTVIVIEKNDGKVGIELMKSQTTIVPDLKSSPPSFKVNITGEANLGETDTKLDVMNQAVLNELEAKVNRHISELVMSAVEKGQKDYQTDIFGFGERIHITDPEKWTKLRKQWEDMFPKVQVSVNVDIKIRRIGTISDPFHNELFEE